MADCVRVDLGGRGYDLRIGAGLIRDGGPAIRDAVGPARLVVVTDEIVAPLYLAALEASLDGVGLAHASVVLPAGEATKDIARLPEIAEAVLDHQIDRKTVLVALGGGVIGDIAGFLAAILLRGIDFVQIPTTLLAQIDSSVGGKTGVDTRQGKNLVGAFHQPRLVLADLGTLATLPPRDMRAGYAEMVKYGLLGDARFFERLERDGIRLIGGGDAGLESAVAHCCRMKAAIVGQDEREAGARALLNLGHTFGHALEVETGFGGALLHGEGVALGMVLAADLSVRLGRLAPTAAGRIRQHLAETGLPSRLADIAGHPFSADRLIQHMAHDKKAVSGSLTFIVLDAIGTASIEHNVDPAIVREVLLANGAG